ncbi:hypothetical protein M2145_002620 [Lachnospiraceae bacterium PF1-21]|uniref:YhcB family protein n=1 Tax=Ohessyouella blattaphilus TaxID=2949333 RepID=A0ABT1EK55_9FIRM|nr:YhcB family protein [Ohessyouella blattaphilus]MCP1111086.1 YhcB family protein [Ohessyouella blattaphilus]MCR8564480.1 YhcB family protein [Ohessyouella blattaphilus]
MKEWEIQRKKKRFILKILAGAIIVTLLFGLIIGAMIGRIKSNQAKRQEEQQEQKVRIEELHEYPVEVDKQEVMEVGYKGLSLLSFLESSDSREEFKSELERYIQLADYYGEYTKVSIEGKDIYDKVIKAHRFYLRIDNEEQSRIEGLYDEETKEYVFGYYEGAE